MSEKRYKKEQLVFIGNPSEIEKKELLDFYNKNFPLSQWSEKYFLNYFKNDAIFYAAKEGNKIAGIVCGQETKPGSRIFIISALAVDVRFRRKGYGRLLLAKILEEIFGKKSIKMACLHFRESNKLENFYSKFGFGNHAIDGAYSNGEPKHYMDLKINRR